MPRQISYEQVRVCKPVWVFILWVWSLDSIGATKQGKLGPDAIVSTFMGDFLNQQHSARRSMEPLGSLESHGLFEIYLVQWQSPYSNEYPFLPRSLRVDPFSGNSEEHLAGQLLSRKSSIITRSRHPGHDNATLHCLRHSKAFQVFKILKVELSSHIPY